MARDSLIPAARVMPAGSPYGPFPFVKGPSDRSLPGSLSLSVVLTGIKPTGESHLGNDLGAIRPALAQAADRQARIRAC